jgi:hypothetical protein
MEQFYIEMESRAIAVQLEQDKKVEEEWRAAVRAGADKGSPVRLTRCKLNFRPRREVLNRLESGDIKLAAIYHRPTTQVDEHGRTTQTCSYYEIYVRENGWFNFWIDDSRK